MLYNHEMVTLLQQLRSRVQSEFGLRIRLTDPDLLTCLANLGHRSRDPFTRDTIVALMKMADLPYSLNPKPRQHQNQELQEESIRTTTITYRGQTIEKPVIPVEHKPTQPATGSKQVYRGQVVSKA